MNKSSILVLVALSTSTWIFQSVDSFRNDLIQPSRQGCIWSMVNNTSPNSFLLDCNLRTLSMDFWNYTFNKDQVEQTSQVGIKCNDKLFFESFLSPNQSLFRLVNLKQIEIDSCKIRKMPGRVFGSLGFLKNLSITTKNGEWSGSVGLEIESGAFEGLGGLEILDLSYNNIQYLHKNVFCPLRSLLKLNISSNRLSDIEELTTIGGGSGYCALNVKTLDVSLNSLRRITSNAFSQMRRLTELKLQNNLIAELSDDAFSSVDQLIVINLSSNRLVALPPSIFRLNNALREINLSNNSISALSPQLFGGLEQLLVLRLSGNVLTSVDDIVFKNLKSLRALHLDGNRIEAIHPNAFSAMIRLQVLDLSRNRISQISQGLLSNQFNLRQLYFDNNHLRHVDDNALVNCTRISDLGLAGNLLQEVPVALRVGLKHLTMLDIGDNKIISVSNDSFQGMNSLYGLRLAQNHIGELKSSFCSNLKQLRVINLSDNRITKIAPTAFTQCNDVRVLRLDMNLLEEITLTNQLHSLLWLNVSSNRIRWADYHLLPKTVEWLDVSSNLIESLGGPTSSSESSQTETPFNLRVLDASNNLLTNLDYTTIPPTLETLRINHNKLKTVASDTFIRSSRLRRVELISNSLENLPLSSLRFPPVPAGKPIPEFYLGGNPFLCDCSMEWLTRVNQLGVLRTHPRIVDLDAIVCRSTFSTKELIPLVETKPKDFLCPYKSHCFALCHCCDFDACDCEMTCPTGCNCYHDTAWSSNIVECSNANYTEVPGRLPMDSTEVYLDGNNLPELKSHVFIGKKNLRSLFLNDSKIEFIRNKTFNGLKSLQILHLEDNFLTELNGYEFADLENLRELYLHSNLLRFIAKETFSELRFLQTLRIDGNLLIDYNVWELSGNGYLNSVMLATNPWTCDCEFLIPFRTWVASKTSIVIDFTLANCQIVNTTHLLAGSSSSSEDHGSSQVILSQDATYKKKLYPIQEQHAIRSMCNHNAEINFNFNPIRAIESDILTNHISAGAEKVTISHPPREIQFNNVDSVVTSTESNTFWFLVLTLTALILLSVVIVVIFRKEIYYWIYTRVCTNNTHELSSGAIRNFLLSLLCCGENLGKKSCRSTGENEDEKLFDAYFISSKFDDEILQQKIAPELESSSQSQGSSQYRLCLHYRDLCLNSDNPWNTDMILSACDASKRVVLVLSKTFLQNELSHSHFRQAIQSAINRHQKKLILILLPPFSEQNLATIYPELRNSKSSTLEWTDKNFWSKLKLILPTPSCNLNTNSRRRGQSFLRSQPAPLIDLHTSTLLANSNNSGTMSSYTINRMDFPYSSQHQYHRNIFPYQIPSSTLNPPVPKHHIALTTPFFQNPQLSQSQQNFNHYGGSQHSSHSQYYMGGPVGANLQNFIHIPGIPHNGGGGAVIYPMNTLPHNYSQQQFSFNESFRRHLQQQQQNHQNHQNPPPPPAPVLQFIKPSGGGGGTGGGSGTTAYQPLEANYSSTSAISSSAEELDHVYSTLDSPLQSPNSVNTTSTNVMNTSGNSDCSRNDSANKLKNKRNSNSNSQSQSFTSNCSNSNNNRKELPGSREGHAGNNGQMYFV